MSNIEKAEPLEFVRRRTGGPTSDLKLVALIKCGRIGCKGASIVTQNKSRLPDQVNIKKFKQRGWKVTSKAKGCRCPKCAQAARGATRHAALSAPPPAKVNGDISPGPQLPPPVARRKPTVAQKGDAVKSHSLLKQRDIRRIFRAIDDAYIDTKVGYKPGVTDGTIAQVLKLPTESVTHIRRRDFGSIPLSPEQRKIFTELEELRGAINQIEDVVLKQIDSLQNRFKKLEQEIHRADALARSRANQAD